MSIEQPRKRHIVEPGEFEAWLVASDLPQDPERGRSGPSSHGWEIRRLGQTTVEDRNVVASGTASEESNGYVTGVYRIAEAVPEGSNVLIWTRSSVVVQALRRGIKGLRARNFKGADRKPLAHADYWRATSDVCTARKIELGSRLLRVRWSPHGAIYNALMHDVKAACAELITVAAVS